MNLQFTHGNMPTAGKHVEELAVRRAEQIARVTVFDCIRDLANNRILEGSDSLFLRVAITAKVEFQAVCYPTVLLSVLPNGPLASRR